MVLGAVGKFGTIAVVLLVTFVFFRKAFADGSFASAGNDLGSGLSGIGSGVQGALGGIGAGLSSLFNPLFTFLDFGAKAKNLFSPESTSSREGVKAVSTDSRPRETNESSNSTSIFSAGSGLPR